MYRTLALSTLALLALDVTTTLAAPMTGLSLTQDAQAADDDKAKVKKAKIKQKTTSSGGYTYTFWLRTSGTSASEIGSADITISDATNGAAMEALTLEQGERGRLVFTGQLDALGEDGSGETVTLTFKTANMIDNNGDPFGEQQEFEVSVDGLDAKPAEDSTEGWKVRARSNAAGQLTVVLGNEDKDWAGGGTVEVTASVDGETPVALTMSEVRQRYKAELSADFVFEDNIVMKAVLLDEEGATLDSFEQTVAPPSESVTPELSQATLKESSAGDAKLVTWTESDGQATALEVELLDNVTGESVLMTTDDTPVMSVRSFNSSTLEFDPGESPEDYVYLALIDLLDSEGDPAGEQMEAELTVPSYDAETGEVGVAWTPYADSTGTTYGYVGIYAYEDGYGVALSHEDSEDLDVDSVKVIFEEPYEGPAPLDTEINLTLSYQADKWIEKGQGSVPEDYTLITTLVTPEGEVLSSTTATGSGTGTVYKNGKGTKKSAITSHQNNVLELL